MRGSRIVEGQRDKSLFAVWPQAAPSAPECHCASARPTTIQAAKLSAEVDRLETSSALPADWFNPVRNEGSSALCASAQHAQSQSLHANLRCQGSGRHGQQDDTREFASGPVSWRTTDRSCKLCEPADRWAGLGDYWVYCIHGKIRIESRPPADVGRSYIASSLCTLGSFRHVSDARSFAQKN